MSDKKNRGLHLIEISPHIYAGAVNKYASITDSVQKGPDGFYTPTIMTGGVAFLFNKVALLMNSENMDVAFVADRAATKKREIDPDYKISRVNRDTSNEDTQKEVAEYVLEKCGFTVLSEEGYEADDLLYNYSKKYSKVYKSVAVHTDDSDNFICCDDNVMIFPARNGGKFITKENYETTVKGDKIIPWNAMSFHNMLHGKPANDLKALPRQDQDLLVRMFWKDMFFPYLGRPEMMLPKLKEISESIWKQAALSYPIIMDEVPDVEFKEPDWDLAKVWGYYLKSSEFKTISRHHIDISSDIAELFRKGYQVN